MKRIVFLIEATLPKRFTRKQFNALFNHPPKQGERGGLITSHPHHYLQRMVEKGILKHVGAGTYQLA